MRCVGGGPAAGGQEGRYTLFLLLKGSAEHASAVVEQVNAALAEHQRIQGFTVWPKDDFPRTHTLKPNFYSLVSGISFE